jgi:hypothetical protein
VLLAFHMEMADIDVGKHSSGNHARDVAPHWQVTAFLDQHFPDWMRGPVSWPGIPPDISPLDYFHGSHIKPLV